MGCTRSQSRHGPSRFKHSNFPPTSWSSSPCCEACSGSSSTNTRSILNAAAPNRSPDGRGDEAPHILTHSFPFGTSPPPPPPRPPLLPRPPRGRHLLQHDAGAGGGRRRRGCSLRRRRCLICLPLITHNRRSCFFSRSLSGRVPSRTSGRFGSIFSQMKG